MKNITIEELEVLFQHEVLEDESLEALYEAQYEEELTGEISAFLYKNNQRYRDIVAKIVELEEEIEEIDEENPMLTKFKTNLLTREIERLNHKLNKMIAYLK